MKSAILAAAFGIAALPAAAGSIVMSEPEPTIYYPESAPSAPPMKHYSDWSGFYTGIHLGWGTHTVEGGGFADSGNGVVLGAHAGYDHAYGHFLIGAGVDVSAAEMELDLGSGWLDNTARARVRGGVVRNKWLFYSTGGAAYADATIVGTAAAEDWGWFAGGGVEYKLDDRKSFGLEALYHKWDDFDGSGVDLDATTIEGRLNWRW